MPVAYTIVTRNHLHRARLLMEDLAQHAPGVVRYVFLADHPCGLFDPAREPFRVLLPEEFGPPRLRHLAFALGPYGLCCLLKPWAAMYLRRSHPGQAVLYLDSDTTLLQSPGEILKAADEHDIVLSPHVASPGLNSPGSWVTMQSGAVNGGILALGSGGESGAFLDWWASNMMEPDWVQLSWLYDQGWLSQAPALFPGCYFFRNAGYNLAFWNLHERPVTLGADGRSLFAGGAPLVHIHLSYFDRRSPELLAGRVASQAGMDFGPLRGVLREYARRLEHHGAAICEDWGCEYARFSDGCLVQDIHRKYFAKRGWTLFPVSMDPFDAGSTVASMTGLRSVRNATHPVTRFVRSLRGT